MAHLPSSLNCCAGGVKFRAYLVQPQTESSGEIPTPNVLIVSHGMAITALLRSINPQAIPYRSVPNASATLLRYNLIGGLQIIGEAGKALP